MSEIADFFGGGGGDPVNIVSPPSSPEGEAVDLADDNERDGSQNAPTGPGPLDGLKDSIKGFKELIGLGSDATKGGTEVGALATIAAVLKELLQVIIFFQDLASATKAIAAGDIGGGIRFLSAHQEELNKLLGEDFKALQSGQLEELTKASNALLLRIAPTSEAAHALAELNTLVHMPRQLSASDRSAAGLRAHRQATRSAIRNDLIPRDYGAFRRSSFPELLEGLTPEQQAEIEASRQAPRRGDVDPEAAPTEPTAWASEPPAGELHAMVTGHAANKLGAHFENLNSAMIADVGGNISGLTDTINKVVDEQRRWIFDMLAPLIRAAMETTFETAQSVSSLIAPLFTEQAGKILKAVLEPLGRQQEVKPGDEVILAKELLGVAFDLGHEAHMTAALAELIMPLKHLGFPQLSAFMVDMAGFKEISSAEIGQHIEQAIKRPSKYTAGKKYRSFIPDPREAEALVLERRLAVEDYAEILRFHGYSEQMVQTKVEAVWIEPRTREVISLIDDTDVDSEWLERKLTEAGLEELDVLKWKEAAERRQVKTYRQQLAGSLVAMYRDGWLSREEFDSNLELEGFGAQPRRLLWARASLERVRELRQLQYTSAERRAKDGMIGLAEFRAECAAIGMDQEVIEQKAVWIEAEVSRSIFRAEGSDIVSLVRDDQAARIKLAQESFTRGLLTEAELASHLGALGVKAETAQAMARLAAVKREPVPKLPVVLSEEAQLQKLNRAIEEAALQAFRKGVIQEDTLGAVLAGTLQSGLDQLPAVLGAAVQNTFNLVGIDAEVAAVVAREAARRRPTPRQFLLQDQTDKVAQGLQVEAALAEYRTGKISIEVLRAKLQGLGLAPAVVEGFIARELARQKTAAPAGDGATAALDPEARRRQRLAEQMAKELFKAGQITRREAEDFLVGEGLDPLTVQALMDLEEVRDEIRQEKEAAKAAAGSAADDLG